MMFRGMLPDRGRALDRLAVAADFDDLDTLKEYVQIYKRVGLTKVGLELISAVGLQPAREVIEDAGGTVLVDLKLKDIPTTVHKAVLALARQGYFAVTIHADGTEEMLRAAVEAADIAEAETGHRILLIGVTRLTSDKHIDDDGMLALAKKAARCGLPAVVCATSDLILLQNDPETCNLLTLVPAIRLLRGDVHDQARPATPAEATAAGADVLVGGRAIFDEDDPNAIINRFERQILDNM